MSIQLETCAHGLIVRHRDPNGVLQSKLVSLDDVAEVLAQRSKMDTGLLPRNTRYYARLEHSHLLALELPPHIRRIEYGVDNVFFDVPMPTTCFILEFNNTTPTNPFSSYYVSLVCLYVVKGPILDDDTVLYRFPYGNVYSDGGQVCLGSVTFPEVASISELSIIPEMVLDSKFNDDLTVGVFKEFADPDSDAGIMVNRSPHLLRYLHGKSSFPYDILLESNTFGNAIRNFNK